MVMGVLPRDIGNSAADDPTPLAPTPDGGPLAADILPGEGEGARKSHSHPSASPATASAVQKLILSQAGSTLLRQL